MIKNCLVCNKEFKTIPALIKRGGGKFCSRACKSKAQVGFKHSPQLIKKFIKTMKAKGIHQGERNPNYKNGKYKTYKGYIEVLCRNHPFACRNYVKEHRIIVEKVIGRLLTTKETVHHINEIKDDNRIENLMVFTTRGTHKRFHINPLLTKSEDIVFDGRLYSNSSKNSTRTVSPYHVPDAVPIKA